MSDESATAEAESAPAEAPEIVESPPAGGTETETPEKRPSRARDRIQALASDKRAAVEYAEFQKQRADALQAQLEAAKPGEPETVTPPDISTYNDASQWASDYSKWAEARAGQIANETIDKRLETLETERTQQQIETDFNASLETAATKHDDYWEVITDPAATHMNGPLLDTLKQLPDAGELAYYLNSNPDEARQIAAKTPTQIAADLGRLSVTLANSQKPEPKANLTTAPEPPSDITGAPQTEPDLSKVSIDDYMRIRREQLKARRGY